MTPEFDEEVVFENSPLYQYLQDLGHTDFEICSSLSPKPETCSVTEGQQKPPVRALPKVRKHARSPQLDLLFFTLQQNKNKKILHVLSNTDET
ncbi:vezatin, adherens junctions transmembrane protein [Phyllostomus discolor]|uniref:Vezatin, adherens junctions transmembrane protein n=1 Tax=Phyllostomus discolor TaxID=89673 RepID=A0A834B7G5_9CHIR|nr:vezatin, adherens junctions transmembrane protein [Phyllostomus discolor]